MAPWMRPERRSGSSASDAGLVGERGPVGVGRRRAEADGEGIGAGDAEPLGIGPADEQRLAGRPGQRPLGDADDAQRQRGAVGGRGVDRRVEREAVARRDARRAR